MSIKAKLQEFHNIEALVEARRKAEEIRRFAPLAFPGPRIQALNIARKDLAAAEKLVKEGLHS